MKTAKKLLLAILILALAAPVTGCSGSDDESKEENKNTSAKTNDTTSQEEIPEYRDFFIEEQEIYNENGIRITVAEQPIRSSLDYTIECDWEYGAGVAVKEVYVNGELVYEGENGPRSNQFPPNEPHETFSYIGDEGVLDALEQSNSDDNELSLCMIVEDPWEEQCEEFTVTIPLIAKAGSGNRPTTDSGKPDDSTETKSDPASKDTAYTTGTVTLAAQNDKQETHKLVFTDGVLTAHYIDGPRIKDGYTDDDIKYSEFYEMTVEQAAELLESRGYTVTIN